MKINLNDNEINKEGKDNINNINEENNIKDEYINKFNLNKNLKRLYKIIN